MHWNQKLPPKRLTRIYAAHAEHKPSQNRRSLKLHVIIQQPNLLSRLERRQTDIRTSIAAEGITQSAVPARSDLALNREIDLGEIVGVEFGEVRVGFGTCRFVLGREAFGETAAAVFAGAATFGVGFAGFGCR
jgi:hypothetical protein